MGQAELSLESGLKDFDLPLQVKDLVPHVGWGSRPEIPRPEADSGLLVKGLGVGHGKGFYLCYLNATN